jgi:hypothetical protein
MFRVIRKPRVKRDPQPEFPTLEQVCEQLLPPLKHKKFRIRKPWSPPMWTITLFAIVILSLPLALTFLYHVPIGHLLPPLQELALH